VTHQHCCVYGLNPLPEALSNNSGASVLPEILWNFSHFEGDKRLTLSQNPHFYVDLPSSPDAYGSTFRSQPTERYEGRIYVLTNDSGRVFFEFGGSSRVFDIFWATNDAPIFKGRPSLLTSLA
jgi:hypothetical protein